MNLFQFLSEGFLMAVGAIRSNRLRSLLTMLGVATGIFAITGILTMVNSLQRSVTDNLSALGNTTMFVHHWPWAENGNEWYKFVNRPKVSYKDYQKLKQNLGRVKGVAYTVTFDNQTIKAQGRSVSNTQLVGFTHDAGLVSSMEFTEGRYFSEVESHLGSPVCLIGSAVSKNLFPDGQPIGQFLTVSGKRMQVIGVLVKKGVAIFGPSDDDRVYVPYNMMANSFNLSNRWIDKVISIKAENHDDIDWVESEVVGIIRAARGLRPSAENNFAINKQEMLMNRMGQFFGFLDMGGWIISLFSILIGGFSIGNIMYISVRERTNEIGVQKALGATQPFILYQFVTESVLLCIMGGLIGLATVFSLGALIQVIMNSMDMPFKVAFAASDILIGLGLSVFIGLVAGIIPASIAARVDPVVAIRHA
ncbi:MAG: ABC transporter permease [Bacteroidetes bacterium]|nr:MAG: ABC transporter permease [Bacteroidota bacterium]